VELLLNHGADPCSVYDHHSGSTLLHIAARDGDHKSLKLLLNHWQNHTQAGRWTPDINTHNFDGKILTPPFTSHFQHILGRMISNMLFLSVSK
jgi:ankyrin repeat protein